MAGITLKQDGRRQHNSSRYYRPYNNQISGLVGNSHFDGLRHRRFESNAALLGISIPIEEGIPRKSITVARQSITLCVWQLDIAGYNL
jgi:hypothetical protein